MEIDILAQLMRVSTVYEKDIKKAVDSLNNPETINEMISAVWNTSSMWHKPAGGLSRVPTITEKEWNNIISLAKAKCESLGGVFNDPTSIWTFEPPEG